MIYKKVIFIYVPKLFQNDGLTFTLNYTFIIRQEYIIIVIIVCGCYASVTSGLYPTCVNEEQAKSRVSWVVL